MQNNTEGAYYSNLLDKPFCFFDENNGSNFVERNMGFVMKMLSYSV